MEQPTLPGQQLARNARNPDRNMRPGHAVGDLPELFMQFFPEGGRIVVADPGPALNSVQGVTGNEIALEAAIKAGSREDVATENPASCGTE